MSLFPLQALALHDIAVYGGAFVNLDVGEGKTLVSLLAAFVLGARRPLLLLPAHLIRKTEDEARELAQHWLIPPHIQLMSYQSLGVVDNLQELETVKPDLIVADEVQKLKNRDAAVTRRVKRYLDANPSTKFVGMTGTIMRLSIHDFAHILRWALKDRAPVPSFQPELDSWAQALDVKLPNEFLRMEPGALLKLCAPEDFADYPSPEVAARRGFRRRLRETPGVVSSELSGTKVDARLCIRALRYDVSPTTDAHFRRLREEKVTPDGWELWTGIEVWQHARELALGFHSIWDPRPPEWWSQPRKRWFAFVRDVLSRSHTLDSPEHVAQACDALASGSLRLPAGHSLHAGPPLLAEWRAVEKAFKPNPVPVWHDDSAVRFVARWMERGPGIVWTEHVAFAQALSSATGAKYYGAKGLAADGSFVDHGDPGRCIIVSVDANREGRNLQKKWSRNLVTSPEEGADKWQQLIGRTHRTGQRAREVTVDVLLGCIEHARAWQKAIAGAQSIRDTVGSESKLLIALERGDVVWPEIDEVESWHGARWGI